MIPFWKKTGKDGKKKPQKPAVPRTAQQSIPMQRMFEDGTCRVKANYYTRTIQYQDINYQLAQQEDKTAIFEEWCSFLNFFDSSIKFELSFVNMATDSTEFEKSIRIPFQKDGFDDVRAEYSQMLRQQLAKGNNGLTKTKFITFGVEGESMAQVKPRLDHIQNDLLNNFHRLGVQAKPLNGVQRLKLMHDMFNMDGASKFHFDWKDLVKSGLSVKDAIAPTAFAFKNSRTFQMGGIKEMISSLVTTTEAAKGANALMKNKIIGICPNCGANVVEREKGWFCENRECRFVLWKDNAFLKRLGKRMDAHVADKLLRDGRVRLKDCKSAKGKTYNATVLLSCEADGRSKFSLEFEGGC